MTLSKKDASTIQETKIANLLDWKKVPGSGARHTLPGDVYTDEWLGECKTHTSEKQTVTFYLNHWRKIQKEAMSKFKYPILFVDNGTQDVENTLCMFPYVMYNTQKVFNSPAIKINKESIVVDLSLALSQLTSHEQVLMCIVDDRPYAITTLLHFKVLFNGD